MDRRAWWAAVHGVTKSCKEMTEHLKISNAFTQRHKKKDATQSCK